MALMTVEVNGKAYVVDADTKALAKKFGREQVKIDVRDVTREDLAGLDLDNVPVLKKATEATEAAADAEAGSDE